MTVTDVADDQLVARVKRGDKRAFDLLVLRYQQRLFALISRYVRDRDEIQDIAQEAFIRAYRALPEFRGESQFYTWLYRIAVNTAKNWLAARGRRPPNTDIDIDETEAYDGSAVLQDHDSPEEHYFGRELQQVVAKAMRDLPDDLRQALMLREFDGLSYEEIAEVMNCPVGTVRSRIFRAREAVDKQVQIQMQGIQPVA
jgi:RNA polymerase sigma-70 factor (ECF subfamily)